MTAAWFGSALAFAFAMSATPGPNNAMVAASGATWGLRRTVPHVLGIAVGFAVMVLAVGLGAGESLRSYPLIQEGLRWIGGSYMLLLAVKIARADPAPAATMPAGTMPAGTMPAGAAGRPLAFYQAALFQWVNPKAWVTAVGAVVTYTSGGSALLGEAAILSAIFLTISTPITLGWTLVGVGAARWLRRPRAIRRFNFAMAALLVTSLIPLLMED